MGTAFVSYASADRQEAVAICDGLEARGVACWMAARDVRPGENYQEAIVRAIRGAGALVLVFSESANRSDEIKKELSLASRFRVPVIATRIADVDPSDAFAYELSTRQWIDLFADRARALDAVAKRIGEQDGTGGGGGGTPASPPARPIARRRPWIAVTPIALLIVAGGSWWFTAHRGASQSPPIASLLEVRLTGFERLTPDIPAGTDAALRDELTAALADEGIVKVSNSVAPPPGGGPAFALGGTVRRETDQIRIVLRLVNERSSVVLWSQSLVYDKGRLQSIPRMVAANAGSILRCGLFGASTYPRTLPDAAMADYLAECQHHYSIDAQPAKGLDLSRKVVAAVPDFSWGWSGVAISATMASRLLPPDDAAPYLREARAAADRAIALDPSNSEAFAWKSMAIDPAALAAREALILRALKVRALSCGCEHHIYGSFLDETGRSAAALGEYQRAVDTLALEFESQESLAIALAIKGDERGAKEHIDTAVELTGSVGERAAMTLVLAPINHDYAEALAAMDETSLPYAKNVVSAWRTALKTLAEGPKGKTAIGVAALVALPDTGQEATITVGLLGALGADRQALALVERRAAAAEWGARSLLFLPSMAHAQGDPTFAATAERLGLMRYWRETKTRPDICVRGLPPPFCRSI